MAGPLVAPAITLDQLIERHGAPLFAKIDVEGFEAEALAGLSQPLQAFSSEFTTILRPVAIDCISRCRALGAYLYNAVLGETQRLVLTQWVDAEAIERWLEALPASANSGDIYARLGVFRNAPRGNTPSLTSLRKGNSVKKQIQIGETAVKWKTPVVVEIAVGLEINAYACAEVD